MWRQAGTLRRQMLGEQVLFAEAAPRPVGEMVDGCWPEEDGTEETSQGP